MREVSENVIKDIEKNVAERKISYSDVKEPIFDFNNLCKSSSELLSAKLLR